MFTWDFVSTQVWRDQKSSGEHFHWEDSWSLPVPKERVMPHPAGPHGEAPGPSGGRRQEEEQGTEPLSWFSKEGEVNTGQAGRSVSWNDLTACWGVGTPPIRPVPGSGVVPGQGESAPPVLSTKRAGHRYGLWTGWFAYEKHALRRVIFCP